LPAHTRHHDNGRCRQARVDPLAQPVEAQRIEELVLLAIKKGISIDGRAGDGVRAACQIRSIAALPTGFEPVFQP
jgi:hypothetical protein